MIIKIYCYVAISSIYCRSTLQTYLVLRRNTESMENTFGLFYYQEEAVVNPFPQLITKNKATKYDKISIFIH